MEGTFRGIFIEQVKSLSTYSWQLFPAAWLCLGGLVQDCSNSSA